MDLDAIIASVVGEPTAPLWRPLTAAEYARFASARQRLARRGIHGRGVLLTDPKDMECGLGKPREGRVWYLIGPGGLARVAQIDVGWKMEGITRSHGVYAATYAVAQQAQDWLNGRLMSLRGGSRAFDLDAIIAKVTAGKAQSTPDGPLRITRYLDYFALHEAPYVLEDRLSERGNSYTAKVYLPEAYTADYMEPSDETGRLLRWGVELSDGRIVSRDGAFRIRFPEKWTRLAGRIKRARGARRHQLAAEELWKMMEPDEREAILDLDLSGYIDGVGEREALHALEGDLKESGSLLWWARGVLPRDESLHARIRRAYQVKHLGGDTDSAAYRSAPWNRWLAYKLALAGVPVGDRTWSLPQALALAADPNEMPLFVTRPRRKGQMRTRIAWMLHPAISSLGEYAASDDVVRAASLAKIRPIITARVGGPWTYEDGEKCPSGVRARRMEWWGRTDARLARMDPDDRELLSRVGIGTALPALLRSLSRLNSSR